MKQVLTQKAQNLSDQQIEEILSENVSSSQIADYKNWGDNFLKIVAEEAKTRGLI